MDYEAEVLAQARHLIEMVDQPAFRDQAGLRLEQLKAEPVYARLPEVIAQERERGRSFALLSAGDVEEEIA